MRPEGRAYVQEEGCTLLFQKNAQRRQTDSGAVTVSIKGQLHKHYQAHS